MECPHSRPVTRRSRQMKKTRRRLLGEAGTVAALGALGSIPEVRAEEPARLPARIAFGSCGHQDKPQPVLRTVVGRRPDLFIYLGDNIYGDTRDMEVLKAKYARL